METDDYTFPEAQTTNSK